MTELPRAVILLSGGLDSATVLAVARAEGHECHCLSFRYGQRHARELDAARDVAQALGSAEWRVAEIDLAPFARSSLTADLTVPKNRADWNETPSTYVPARNLLFLSHGLAWAETLEAEAVYIGISEADSSGYPDCRADFLEAFRAVAALATAAGRAGRCPAIRAPLLTLSKAETIQLGISLGVDYGLTHSCYDPDAEGAACGCCDACVLRRRGFLEAGVPDPTRYRPPAAS